MTENTAPRSPTPIMLLGTFHFEDRGLDAYKPKFKLDIKARRAEILEVVESLAVFKPTKEDTASIWLALSKSALGMNIPVSIG